MNLFFKTAVFLVVTSMFLLAGCGNKTEKVVVVYTSVDQEYAEPIFKNFEASTGIKVLPVFDVEAAKTTGLVNRLIAEKNRPQADVFWSSEFMQTLLLKEKGVLTAYKSAVTKELPAEYRDPEYYWNAFGGRARVLLVNTNLVPPDQYPISIFELGTSEYGAGKAGIAYPMFGTAATHAAALYAALGPERGRQYFVDLKKQKVQTVDGNSVVRDLVAQGNLKMGMTDSDDAQGAIEKGAPVKMIMPDQDGLGTMIVPNTVAIIAGGPHADTAKQFVDYLLSQEVETELLKMGCIQVPTRSITDTGASVGQIQIKKMKMDFMAIYQQLPIVKKDLTEIFR